MPDGEFVPVSPAEGLARLREGNARFVRREGTAYRAWQPGLIEQQRPFAVVLGCADSRAPVEYVFDQGLGDLFVVRVAGNIVAPSLVGSIEFAAENFGTRLVVVMGHTHCGAVGATVSVLEGGPISSRNLQSITDRITPHITHLFDAPVPHRDRRDLIAEAVRVNALASAAEVRKASPLLEGLVARGQVEIVAAVYDVATGDVAFLDR